MRKVIVFLVIASVGLLLSSPVMAKKTKLTLWQAFATDPENAYIKEKTMEFNKAHPEIQVEYSLERWETRREKVMLAYGRGLLPDLIMADSPSIPEWVAMGIIAPLDEIDPEMVTKWKPQFVPEIWEVSSYQGHLYQVPSFVDCNPFLVYNKKVLEEAGFTKPPETWEELIAVAQKVNKPGYAGILLAATKIYLDMNAIEGMIYANGGRWLSEDGEQVVINGPGAVDVLKLWVDLVRKYKVTEPGVTETNYMDATMAFFQGKGAMVLCQSWADVMRLESGAPEDYPYGLAFAPRRKTLSGKFPRASFVMGAMNGVFITTTSKHKKEAMVYADLFASEEILRGWIEKVTTFRVPVVKSAFESAAFQQQYPDLYVLWKKGELFREALPQPAFNGISECEMNLADAWQAALLGIKEPQEALDECKQLSQDVIDSLKF